MSRELRRVPLDFSWPDDPRITWDEDGLTGTPPKGEGWQAWETVSEGSPVSPVFATPDELVDWAVSSEGRLGIADTPVSRAAAEAFVEAGESVTMMYTPERGLLGGVEALARDDRP